MNRKPNYHDRIQDLKSLSGPNDPWSTTTECDFHDFMFHMPFYRRAELAMTPDGNLRAVWRGSGEVHKHVGVEFLGMGRLKYVIWRRKEGDEAVKVQTAQLGTFKGFKQDITDKGLLSFLQDSGPA